MNSNNQKVLTLEDWALFAYTANIYARGPPTSGMGKRNQTFFFFLV